MAINKDVLIRLGAKMAPAFSQAINRARGMFSKLKGYGESAFTMKNMLIGGAGALAVRSIYGMAKGVGEASVEMQKLHNATGIAYETLSKMKYAADTSGMSIDDFSKAFKGVALVMGDADRGLSTALDTLRELGLNSRELKGMGMEQIFLKAAAAVMGQKDQTKQLYLAQKIFGKSGTELLGILGQLNEKFDEARTSGVIWTEAMIADGAKIDTAVNKFEKALEKLKTKAMLRLAPYLGVLAGMGTEGQEDIAAARNMRAFSDAVWGSESHEIFGMRFRNPVRWAAEQAGILNRPGEFDDEALSFLRERNRNIELKKKGDMKIKVTVEVDGEEADLKRAAGRAARNAAAGER